MATEAEAQVRDLLAGDVETLRVLPPARVTIRRDLERDDQRPVGDRGTFDLGVATARVPVRPSLDVGRRLPAEVAKLVEDAVRAVYPEEDTPFLNGLWQSSYTDMMRAMSLFHDPSGIKRKLLGSAIEPFVAGRRDAPGAGGNPGDLLNERREEWRHPADAARKSRDSFWDLWETALADGERLLRAAAAWLNAVRAARAEPRHADHSAAIDALWREFTDSLGDVSYETGLPSDP